MFVTTQDMLLDAQRGGYAIGAFNAENAEMVWAIIQASEEMRAPVIIQTTTSTLKYFGAEYFAGMCEKAAARASTPIALHLDHGASAALAQNCVEAGYTSVMIDGSSLPFEQNIAVSKQVCDFAQKLGIPVEAELGVVGGKEDDTVADANRYTDPLQAADFVGRTGVSSLAVSIGTAHGIYAVEPVLDLNRITEIRKLVSVPLVLHGASGLPDDTVRQAVALGMCKVNFATELRIAYSDAVKACLAQDPGVFDPKKYGTAGRQAVKELVKRKIEVCGSRDKA